MRWSLDPEGAVAHTSEEWKRFTGMTDREMVGSAARRSVHAKDQDVVASIIHAAVEQRTSFLVAFRSRRANDDYAWVMAGAVPSFSLANGTFLGYLGDTEMLTAAPEPPKVMDMLHHVPKDRRQIAMLDAVADHITTARKISQDTDAVSLKKILDLALLCVGDYLYRSIGSNKRS